MRAVAFIATLALSVVAGCVTHPSDDDGASSPEEVYFNANVKPVLAERCARCHAPPDGGVLGDSSGKGADGASGFDSLTGEPSNGGAPAPANPALDGLIGSSQANNKQPADRPDAPHFLGSVPSHYYKTLVARKDFVSCDVGNSILLLKGADPSHPGVALPEGAAPKVRAWLEMEAQARFDGVCSPGSTVPGDGTGADAMKEFGDCSTYADWVAAGVPKIAAQETTFNDQNNVKCYACHNNPETGHNHMADPENNDEVMKAFQDMRYMYPSFNLVRWSVNPKDGAFENLVPSYRWRDKGHEGTAHPKFDLKPEYASSYMDWFNRTYARWIAARKSGVKCVAADGDPKPAAAPAGP